MTQRIGTVIAAVLASAGMWHVSVAEATPLIGGDVLPTAQAEAIDGQTGGLMAAEMAGEETAGTETRRHVGEARTGLQQSQRRMGDFRKPPGSGPASGGDPADNEADDGGAGGPGVPPDTGEDG